MKENTLNITIIRPVSEVFAFTINPNKTPLWISSIVKEEAEQPVGTGTKFRNINRQGEWSEYVVSAFELNKLFELSALNST